MPPDALKACRVIPILIEVWLSVHLYYLDKSSERLQAVKHFHNLFGTETKKILKHVPDGYHWVCALAVFYSNRNHFWHISPVNISPNRNVIKVRAVIWNHRQSRVTDIVIVNSKLLKRHSNAKRRAPAYSRALRQIRVVVHRIVHGRLRSGCQRVREGRLGVKAGVVYAESGEKEDQVSQGKSFWRDGTQTCMFQELWNYCNLFTLLTKLTACSHERAIEGRSIIWAMFANSWMFCSRLLHWHSLGLWP